jgi:hypothetical protein
MDPKLFGRYQIIRKLAGGGMGRVFLAYDPVLNRQVGLKLIDAGGDRDSLEVIAAERRGATLQDQLAKRESSGRVAQIFDVGEREGYFYIAMEYIEGEDLSELVSRGPLPPERAVGIALDILDVLVKAHSFHTVIDGRAHRGIIHGDIKPRNIRITPGGQVKVLDFGIAKAVSMTRSITFNQFGSVPYSSPERLQTGDMDARSDVWAVAIVLFEMLTGKAYFEAEASSKLEWLIRNYKTLNPSVARLPSGLREILSRGLDPDLNKRFASAAAFQSALHEWRRFANPDPVAATEDFEATRRTAYANAGEQTRRSTGPSVAPPKPVGASKPAPRYPLRKRAAQIAVAVAVTLFLAFVFSVVYEFRMWGNARNLAKQVESGEISLNEASRQYKLLAAKSGMRLPLAPARNSLRELYETKADRIVAAYEEDSESRPVSMQDWNDAYNWLKAALDITPDDKTLRGKLDTVLGYINLLHRDSKKKPAPFLTTAHLNFDEAKSLLPRSPAPHLGLAQIYLHDIELERAEDELNEARRDGFNPGRRETFALAEAYRRRGEKLLNSAARTHDLGQMQDSLKKADDDLSHAQTLYTQVVPFLNGDEMAEKVLNERQQAQRSIEAARLVTESPKENP